MTRQQKYDDVIARLQKAENRERYHNAVNHPTDSDRRLADVLEKMRRFLNAVHNDDVQTKLFENSFDKWYQEVIQILNDNEQGWK